MPADPAGCDEGESLRGLLRRHRPGRADSSRCGRGREQVTYCHIGPPRPADGHALAGPRRATQGEYEWRRRSTSRHANRAPRTSALRRSSGWPPTSSAALGRRAELRVDDALPQAGERLRAAAEDCRRASFRGVRVHHAGAVLCDECVTRSRLARCSVTCPRSLVQHYGSRVGSIESTGSSLAAAERRGGAPSAAAASRAA